MAREEMPFGGEDVLVLRGRARRHHDLSLHRDKIEDIGAGQQFRPRQRLGRNRACLWLFADLAFGQHQAAVAHIRKPCSVGHIANVQRLFGEGRNPQALCAILQNHGLAGQTDR